MTSGDENEAGQGTADDLSDWMRRGPYHGQPGPPAQSVGRDVPPSAGPSFGAPVSSGGPTGDRWRRALPLIVVFLAGLLVGLLLGLLIG